jgi:NAD(P)-dependent dehydrogenase (short-subunit alcohol dehydrogenase family)
MGENEVEFAGKNVVVTGVGREGQVGEAVAAAFANAGARLFLIDRQETQARARADALPTTHAAVTAFGADLSDPVAVDTVVHQVRTSSNGSIDALVHLAGGFASSGPIADSDPALWVKQFSINATTAYVTARAFIPLLRASRGSLVLFASEAVLPGGRTSGISAYAAAKGAVVTLMETIAQEERAYGIRANALAPTSIRTAANVAEMGKDAAYVSREDVARVVLWLCSDASKVVNGQLIQVR